MRLRTIALLLPALLLALTSADAFAQRGRRPRRGGGRPAKQPPAQPAQPQPAQPTDAQVQRARHHYERARELFSAGEFNDALTNFLAAYEARPHPIVYKSIAECYERLDDFRHAVDYLDRYLRELPTAGDRDEIQTRIGSHRSRPSRIRVASDPPGAMIVVDGREINQRTPGEIELSPGSHRVGVRKDGFRESSMELQLEFAERRDLNMSLESATAAAATRPAVERAQGETRGIGDEYAEPTAPPGSTTSSGRVSSVVYVTGGLTVAALIGGAVLGVLVLGDKAAFEATPTVEIANRGEQMAFMTDITLGVAVAAGLTTILLVALGGSGADSATAESGATQSVLLVPAVGVRGAGLTVVGRF